MGQMGSINGEYKLRGILKQAALISDAEKAVDNLNWEFLFEALEDALMRILFKESSSMCISNGVEW